MNTILKITSIGLVTGVALSIASVTMADNRPSHGQRDAMMGQRGMTLTFADLDTNADGQITEEDLTMRAAERFTAADTDGNGAVTMAELTTAMVAQINAGFSANTAANNPARPSDLQIAARAERMAERMFDRAGVDYTATLDADQMQPKNGFGRMIDRFDRDDDNAVSQAEFDAAKTRMGNRGKHGDRAERGGNGEQRGQGDRGRW